MSILLTLEKSTNSSGTSNVPFNIGISKSPSYDAFSTKNGLNTSLSLNFSHFNFLVAYCQSFIYPPDSSSSIPYPQNQRLKPVQFYKGHPLRQTHLFPF